MSAKITQPNQFAPYVEELRELQAEHQDELEAVVKAMSVISPIYEFGNCLLEAGELCRVVFNDKHPERPGVTLTATPDGRGLYVQILNHIAEDNSQYFVSVEPTDFSAQEVFDIVGDDAENSIDRVYKYIVDELALIKAEYAVSQAD